MKRLRLGAVDDATSHSTETEKLLPGFTGPFCGLPPLP